MFIVFYIMVVVIVTACNLLKGIFVLVYVLFSQELVPAMVLQSTFAHFYQSSWHFS